MIEAAICSRVSSREQQQKGFSLKGQAKLLREYAERNGFEIVKAFEGVESVSECKGSFEKFISLAGNEK